MKARKMALKLHFPKDEIPHRAVGTIDGTTPVQFEDHGDRWSLQIGTSFRHEARYDAPKTRIGSLRSALYHAVARYRNASRGLMTPHTA